MKALVLSSGGVDSTTCLAVAIDKYGADNVVSLSVFYGQKHGKELAAARAISDYYNIKHIELNLEPIFEGSNCSLLTRSKKKIPTESYAEQLKKTGGKPVSTYVPFRNGLFLAVAASIAISHGCEVIYYGAHADDAAGNAYPDCSLLFTRAMCEAINIGSGCGLVIEAPFNNCNKAGVVKEGLKLGVPYELTWSCYEGGDKPCGKCGTCIDRKKAFEANGVVDPAQKEKE